MAATIGATLDGTFSSSTTPSVTAPATVNANDLLCFILATVSTDSDTWTAQNGYTKHVEFSNTGRSKVALFYKTAVGTEDGSTQNPVSLASARAGSFVSFVLNAGTYNTITPFQASPATFQEDAISVTTVGPTITTVQNDQLYIAILVQFNSSRTHDSATSPLTKIDSRESINPGVSLWSATQAVAGTTGQKQFTLSGFCDVAGAMLYVNGLTVHAGAASVSGAASISATGQNYKEGASSLSGEASINAVAQAVYLAAAALSGNASIIAAAINYKLAVAALEGNGSVLAPGVLVKVAEGLLQASGELLAGASVTYGGQGSLMGTASISPFGVVLFAGMAEITGNAEIVADHIWWHLSEDEAPEARYTFGMGSRRRATYTFQESTPPAKVTFKVER